MIFAIETTILESIMTPKEPSASTVHSVALGGPINMNFFGDGNGMMRNFRVMMCY